MDSAERAARQLVLVNATEPICFNEKCGCGGLKTALEYAPIIRAEYQELVDAARASLNLGNEEGERLAAALKKVSP